MIVIVRNTEEKLLEELRVCKDKNPAQRCFYLEFSSAGIPKMELFEHFLRLLNEVPDSYRAQVYICRDQDIFILMQGFMQRHFTDFLNRLAHELRSDHLLELSDLMEVGVHWTRLEALCQRKIEKIQAEHEKETEENQKAAAEKVTLEVLDRLSPDLLASIAQRRTGRTKPSIMAVDDDQIARTLVGNVVRERYDCICAKDGQEALAGYVSNAPDALFLDIGLPDINGHDVLECIFQIDPDAYVIMFSGRKDKGNIMRALEAGAQGFIGKPFTREKLFQYIERSPHLIGKKKQENGYATTVS